MNTFFSKINTKCDDNGAEENLPTSHNTQTHTHTHTHPHTQDKTSSKCSMSGATAIVLDRQKTHPNTYARAIYTQWIVFHQNQALRLTQTYIQRQVPTLAQLGFAT